MTTAGDAEDAPSLAKLLPRIKPVEPRDALKTFRLARGFALEMVACEPLLSDPVDGCFDADGRMFVAEMHGYPFSQEPTQLNPRGGGKKDAGIVRLLEDTDGDGTFERSVVFADKISWPTSVCCYSGGVFVLAPPHIYYFKDTDGDDRADLREIVYSGFSRSNVQALANNMKWGLDHHIYLAGGRNGAELTHRGRKLFTLRNQDVCFDPATEELELVSGGSQFGRSMDDWGNWFTCSNSDHIQHVVFADRYLKRNPYLAVPAVLRSIAREGGAGQVFRISPPEPWRIVRQIRRAREAGYQLVQTEHGGWRFVPLAGQPPKPPPEYPIGYFTSATGVTVYRGDAYPPEYRGNVFVGDVGGNLVHRKILKPSGASFTAERADRDTEIVRSNDNWFRPVNFVNAPDGTLFILDMYRETIEHPHSIPEDIKAHLHLESGDDRGRVYRLVPPRMKRRRPLKLSRGTTAQLVAALDSDNGWQRMTAHRLLWERQDAAAVEPLRDLARSSSRPVTRMHALWSLEGLEALTPEVLIAAVGDADPRVREHAVRLAEGYADESPQLVEKLIALADDAAPRVRLQLASSLGELQSEHALAGLVRLAPHVTGDRDLRTAFLSSAGGRADALLGRLLSEKSAPDDLLAELARIVGSSDDAASLRLLAAVADPRQSAARRQMLLTALGGGLSRRGATIPALLAGKTTDADLRRRVTEHFRRAADDARNDDVPLARRQAVVGLLAFAEFTTAAQLADLLTPQTPQALQLAAVNALAEHRDRTVSDLLLAPWRTYSPAVRREVVEAMLTRKDRTAQLLAAVESKHIQPAEIERDKKQLLLNHVDAQLRSQAQSVFGNEADSNRAKVVAEYQTVLELEGDLARGRELFVKNCAVCHKLGDVGHQVGPEFTSVQNKSPQDLLITILDPNREAQPNFTTYTVVTTQGKLLSGIIAAETANSLTLRRAEGKEDVVLRSEIETLVSNGKSLMPEGLEKDLTPQQLADVIAFVQTILPTKP